MMETSYVEKYFSAEDGVQIHALIQEGKGTPILFVPGMVGNAFSYAFELSLLPKHYCASVSHRGCFPSQTPPPGNFGFSSRLLDLSAVTQGLYWKKYSVFAYSRGVALAVAHAIKYRAKVHKLVLVDCEPIYPAISSAWVDRLMQEKPDFVTEETLRRLQLESTLVDLYSQVGVLDLPILLIRGAKTGSLVSSEGRERMIEHFPTLEEVVLPHSGHEPVEEDFSIFNRAWMEFLID